MYDYDDYEPTEEEMEEAEGEESTKAEFDWKNLKIEFDVQNFAMGIANEVKRTLKKEIIAELKKNVLDGLKDDIRQNISTMSEEIVREVYENEKVILGGWGEEKQEITIKQYLLNGIRDSFKDGKFIVKKENSYGRVEEKRFQSKITLTAKSTFPKYKRTLTERLTA